MLMVENPIQSSILNALLAYGGFNIGHNGIPSLGYFVLMIKNNIPVQMLITVAL
jgi:hypothetical protein